MAKPKPKTTIDALCDHTSAFRDIKTDVKCRTDVLPKIKNKQTTFYKLCYYVIFHWARMIWGAWEQESELMRPGAPSAG